MSADDQTFLDVLNAVGSDVKKYSGEYLDMFDRGFNSAAKTAKETLSSQSWVPESWRPTPPPKPTSMSSKVLPVSLYTRINHWVMNNKLLTGTFVVGLTATTVGLVYRSRRHYSKKRRAKRASNNARLEVILLAGSPSEPVVRSLALDLERRGFIVFVICNDVEDEVMVQNEGRPDIRPLTFDLARPDHSIERFRSYLQTSQHAFEGAKAHHLMLSAFIIVPTLTFPAAPLATLSASAVSDIITTRLTQPVLLMQAFLPLLTQLPFNHSQTTPNPKVLVLTPSIIPALNPPFHIPESTIASALTAFTESLHSELSPLSIPVTQVKLGTFDLSSVSHKGQSHAQQAFRAETLRWSQAERETYGANYLRMMENGTGTGRKGGSPLRELHNAVFDTIETRTPSKWLPWVSSTPSVIRVGQGSGTYSFVGAWFPRSLVGWMMGVRAVERTQVTETMWASDEDISKSLTFQGDFVNVSAHDAAKNVWAGYQE